MVSWQKRFQANSTTLLKPNDIDYFKLRNEAIYHMEDFKIFGLQWQRRLIENNLEVLKHAEI